MNCKQCGQPIRKVRWPSGRGWRHENGDSVCEDKLVEPGSDIEYYAEPVSPKALQDMLTPGVSTGYVVFRDANGEVEEVLTGALISEGEGRFYWEPTKEGE